MRCLVNSPGLAPEFGSRALPWGSYHLIQSLLKLPVSIFQTPDTIPVCLSIGAADHIVVIELKKPVPCIG